MEVSGTIASLTRTPDGSALIKVRVPAWQASDEAMNSLTRLQRYEVDVKIRRHRDRRSLDANALCWKCIDSLAAILRIPSEDVYLKALDDYGSHVYLTAVPEAEEKLRRIYRVVRKTGESNGMASFRCTLGSSKYDTEEMSVLLDGIISECREQGGFVPPEKEIRTGLEIWKWK